MEVGLPSANADAGIVVQVALLDVRLPNNTLEPTGLEVVHHREQSAPAAQRERWAA